MQEKRKRIFFHFCVRLLHRINIPKRTGYVNLSAFAQQKTAMHLLHSGLMYSVHNGCLHLFVHTLADYPIPKQIFIDLQHDRLIELVYSLLVHITLLLMQYISIGPEI